MWIFIIHERIITCYEGVHRSSYGTPERHRLIIIVAVIDQIKNSEVFFWLTKKRRACGNAEGARDSRENNILHSFVNLALKRPCVQEHIIFLVGRVILCTVQPCTDDKLVIPCCKKMHSGCVLYSLIIHSQWGENKPFIAQYLSGYVTIHLKCKTLKEFFCFFFYFKKQQRLMRIKPQDTLCCSNGW